MALFFSFLGRSQEGDFASWTSVKVEYEPNDDWTFALSANLRFKENVSVVDEYFPQLKIDRRIVKGLKLAVGGRYIRENDTKGNIQGYENHFRYQLDAKYKHDVQRFSLKYRVRYQNKKELESSIKPGGASVKRLRFRATVEYNIGDWKLDPELAFELLGRFNEDAPYEIDKYYLTLGTQYKIKKAGSIGTFYRIIGTIGQEESLLRHIIGLSYTYTFKN